MPDLELRADYDHDGRFTGSQSEYDARGAAPGSIFVANADVDRRPFPNQVTAGSSVTLDYDQPTKSGGDDELLTLQVRINNAGAIAGRQLLFRVASPLGVRTRIYDDRGIILQSPDPSSPGDHPFATPSASPANFQLELRAYPGSPYAHAILLDTLFTPDNVNEIGFTIALIARDSSGAETVLDTGSFSAAPILFLDNGARATRLYICDTPDTAAALTDVRAALPALGGVQLVTVPMDVANGDTWLQDQFQPGIVVGSDGWRHAIIHLPRMRSNFVGIQSGSNLASFVTSHFPAHDVGLMDDFWSRQLSFADATGRRTVLEFRDCIRLSNIMSRVPALVRAINDNSGMIDRDFEPPALTWPEMRRQLPQIVSDFAARANRARHGSDDFWNQMLQDWVNDARARAAQIVSSIPAATSPGAFTLTVGNQSFELGGDLADKVYRRAQQMEGSANYGGNIEGAPPTPDAPLGRIIVGNAIISDGDNQTDHIDPDVLRFLNRQKQPVVEVDSTWLDVGHIDEMLTFVPNRGSGLSFAVLRASSKLAMDIIRAAAARYRAGLSPEDPQTSDIRPSGVLERLTMKGPSPVTRLMRGKLWLHSHPRPTGPGDVPDILEPPRIYQRLAQAMDGGDPNDPSLRINVHEIHYWPGPGPERVYPADISVLELMWTEQDAAEESTNDFIEERFLAPVDKDLLERFRGLRIFQLPVVFDRTRSVEAWRQSQWSASTSAFTPDVVNMQVINNHLLIPRPYGPRMKPADAQAVLAGILETLPNSDTLRSQLTPQFLMQPALLSMITWIIRHDSVSRPTSSIGTITRVFDGLTTIVHVAQAFRDSFPGVPIAGIEQRILSANARQFTPSGDLRDGWRRLVIADGMVDLFEAYILLVARVLGLTVNWVDTWFYHTHFGGIHCGTNVLRVPERGQLPAWWTV